jgi:hypothetical protein
VRKVRVELDHKPFRHQRAAHAMRLAFRFLVLVWHRRAGKTVFAVLELVLAAAACTKPDGRYAYICPLLKQSKAVVWLYLLRFTMRIPGIVKNESELSITLPNGAQVRLFGADNPDAFRGLYFDGVVLDEVAQMRPQVWGEIIRPALADRLGWAIFIGTPKGVNLFSELYYRALGGEPGWKADMRRASETGIISAEELESARRDMSEAQFAQEMECDFAAAVEDVLLKLDDVLTAQKRELRPEAYDFAAKVLGVDCARYGSDRSCLFPRQGLAGFEPKVLKGLNTMQLAGHVAQAIDTWKPDATFVDTGGIGAGVFDRLQQLGYQVYPVDFGSRPLDPRFENKRAEMWWTMADWVKAGGALPGLQELAQDLTAPTYTYKNARGRFQLESKDDMRARGLPSPDVGDALACTFAEPVAPREKHGGTGPSPNVVSDYEVYGDE